MFKKITLFFCVLAVAGFAKGNKISDDDTSEAASEAVVEESDKAAGSESYADYLADDRAQRKQFEQDQRLDEYANSLRRRDWLKDRLVFQLGMGSRQPVMGETGLGMGFGFGAEYITALHIALYGSFGFIPSGKDSDFADDPDGAGPQKGISLEGGTGWKVGLNYYLFPKNPIHLGLSASYGTVYFDHDIVADSTNDFTRELISTMGYQFDVLVTYLTNEWYFLQFSVGMYYAPKAHDDSFDVDPITKEETSRVVDKDGISKWGLVFGITIGFALPEFFPDDTEKRRRERESRNND
jgi:hypothetical protein